MDTYDHFPNIPALGTSILSPEHELGIIFGSYATQLSINGHQVYLTSERLLDFIIEADVYTGKRERALNAEAQRERDAAYIDAYLEDLASFIKDEREEGESAYYLEEL